MLHCITNNRTWALGIMGRSWSLAMQHALQGVGTHTAIVYSAYNLYHLKHHHTATICVITKLYQLKK